MLKGDATSASPNAAATERRSAIESLWSQSTGTRRVREGLQPRMVRRHIHYITRPSPHPPSVGPLG